MDITLFRQYLADATKELDQYEVYAAKVTAITGASNGVLTVNGFDLGVSGVDFTDLLDAEILEATTDRDYLLTSLESIVDNMKLEF